MLQGLKNYLTKYKKKQRSLETVRITTRNRAHPKGSKTEKKEKGETRENIHRSDTHIFYLNTVTPEYPA
jgi:hypothetical protein